MRAALQFYVMLIGALWWVKQAQGFYTELIPGETRKCYMITTFPSEDILVHIKMPPIQDPIKVEIECYVEGQLLFTKEIKKPEDKITISLDNSVSPGSIEEAQTCIKTTLMAQSASDRERIKNSRYLIWFTHHGNFIRHIESSQKNKKEGQYRSEDLLKSITEKISNMNETYEEQLKRFYRSQENDKKNEKLVAELIRDAYYFTVLQTLIILGSAFAYCWVLFKHL